MQDKSIGTFRGISICAEDNSFSASTLSHFFTEEQAGEIFASHCKFRIIKCLLLIFCQ